jgi:3-hydroxy-9,10-secoandrosta-1,3,5(10)-triene-9,17-dione monooxygenase reductase component
MAESLIGLIPAQVGNGRVRVAEFKRVMSRYPTGVVVVAASYDGKPYGMAVNSFTSVSLDPMLLMFCANRSSSTWPRLRAAGRFAVSVLSAEQESTCRVFATKGADRFATLSWSYNRSGQPVLDHAIAWLDCAIDNVMPGGDHDIVLGRVLDVDDRPDGDPLVFHRGAFVSLRAGSGE